MAAPKGGGAALSLASAVRVEQTAYPSDMHLHWAKQLRNAPGARPNPTGSAHWGASPLKFII